MNSCVPLEDFALRLINSWRTIDLKPAGQFVRLEKHVRLPRFTTGAHPSTHYVQLIVQCGEKLKLGEKPKCPEDWISDNNDGLPKDRLYDLYWHVALRYSCSSLVTAFVEASKKLSGLGFTKFEYDGNYFEFKKFKVVALQLHLKSPGVMHVVSTRTLYGVVNEAVEANLYGYISHNLLMYDDRMVLDFTGSQFGLRSKNGSIIIVEPKDEYIKRLSTVFEIECSSNGEHFFVCTPQEMEGELRQNGRLYIWPTVERSLQKLDSIKLHCKCCGNEGNLQRCAKCKQVYYDSRFCQAVDWKYHKLTCATAVALLNK